MASLVADFQRKHAKTIADARKIAQRAKDENRDFTAPEREQVATLIAEAERLRDQVAEAQDDDALLAKIAAFDKDIFTKSTGGRAAGSALPGPWGRAFAARGTKDASLAPSGSLDVPSLISGISVVSDGPRSLLQLVPHSGLGNSTFRFVRETVHQQAAASVPMGAVKPKSTYTLEPIDERARTVAHLSSPVDNITLADSADVIVFLDNVMRSGVELAIEEMILMGDSTVTSRDDFDGLDRVSGTRSQMWDTDIFTTVRRALLTLEATSKLPGPFTVVMSPTHFAEAELVQSTERYVMGDPGTQGRTLPLDAARRTMWGSQVVTSVALEDTDECIVGQFDQSSIELFEREACTITWSEAMSIDGATAFERNMRQFRAESRVGLAVKRPYAFNVVSLSGHQGS